MYASALGVDGVDLDGDGEVAEHETLRLLESWYWEWDYNTGQRSYFGLGGRIDADADYVWLDTNGDGVRNVGAAAGFTEQDPAYGEPIFALDDADLDGTIEPGERLLRLDQSRIRVAFTDGQAWRRGTNLVDYPVEFGQAMHGTGVLGILSGGLSRHASRFPGLLPEVDLLLWAHRRNQDSDTLGALLAAEEEGVQVVLHEYTSWSQHPLDGSDPVDLAIDAQAAGGIVHVCPAGNLGGAGKHAQALPSVSGVVEFDFFAPPSEEWASYGYLTLGLHTSADPLPRRSTSNSVEPAARAPMWRPSRRRSSRPSPTPPGSRSGR